MLGSTHCPHNRFIPWDLDLYATNNYSLVAFCLSGQPIHCELNWHAVQMKYKTSIYIQEELKKWFQKCIFSFSFGYLFCFYWRYCFYAFPFYKCYKVQVLFIFSDEVDMKRWNLLKDYVYKSTFLDWVIL